MLIYDNDDMMNDMIGDGERVTMIQLVLWVSWHIQQRYIGINDVHLLMCMIMLRAHYPLFVIIHMCHMCVICIMCGYLGHVVPIIVIIVCVLYEMNGGKVHHWVCPTN